MQSDFDEAARAKTFTEDASGGDRPARLADFPPSEVEMVAGQIRRKGTSNGIGIAEVLRRTDTSEIVGSGSFAPEKHGAGLSMCNFGVVFVEVGIDPQLGLLRLRRAVGARDIGELGATGIAAAVANAVFHATDKRIRDLPITPEKLIA